MLEWFNKHAQSAVLKAATQDIERQLQMLMRSSNDDVGLVLASATFWRLFWEQAGMLPKGAISLREVPDELACASFRQELRRQISEDKRSSPAGAIGMTVWLNTSWALSIPELRPTGRQMWKELSRGVPYASAYVPQFFEAARIPVPADVTEPVRFIPPGLEPQ